MQAVIRVGTEPTVYVKTGKSSQPRKVKTGLDNNKMIHILEGLDDGDVVLLNPPLKSAAVSSESHNNLQAPPAAEEMQEKISERLNNVETKKPETDKNAVPENDSSDTKERKRRSGNLTPEQREEMSVVDELGSQWRE
jgi:HlyD family secretion protein